MTKQTITHNVSVWRRLGAIFYDALLVIALLMIANLPPTMIWGNEINANLVSSTLHRLYLLTIWASYFIAFWSISGQTPAMRVWKIKLTQEPNKPPTRLSCLRRWLMAWSLFLVFPLFSALLKKPTWYDRYSNSYLVKING